MVRRPVHPRAGVDGAALIELMSLWLGNWGSPEAVPVLALALAG